MSKSIGDYLVDRTESLDDKLIKEYFIDKEDGKIKRLLDTEQYLLEGSRGIGKTMLMKSAAIMADENYSRDSVLAVWISFEESLRLERIQMNNSGSLDPFLQWTMGKIMLETFKKIIFLKPDCLDKLQERLASIFKVGKNIYNYKYYTDLLTAYVDLLEKGDIKSNEQLEIESPSQELSKILDNPHSFKTFILSLCDQLSVTRIVFLFDEAAHVFSSSQQEKFFTFFKSLRDSRIACKAAVYPGLTNYGKYFERGQDAKELRITWLPTDENDISYINRILKRRIQSFNESYWNKLTADESIIQIICVCSNGNPRFAFHIIDELENKGAFKKNVNHVIIINTIRSVFEAKWREFNTLESRMPKYKTYIAKAENFVKNTLIHNLRVWNDKRRKSRSKLSLGFYVETGAYDAISKVFDILAYSNIINIDYSKKSIKQGQYGYYILLNPSILFTDLIIKDIEEISKSSIAIENNQAYYLKSVSIRDLIKDTKEDNTFQCSNSSCSFTTSEMDFSFCPKCGAEIQREEEVSLYRILRSHSIDMLGLTPGIAARIKGKFENIGQLQDADKDDIRMKYIQDVRIERIKNAVSEYMSG